MNPDWIQADWPAPARVRALCTTRSGGVSVGPWTSLNLGSRCGDDPGAVQINRERLSDSLPIAPLWLHQVHGASAVAYPDEQDAEHSDEPHSELKADAVVSCNAGQVCAVLTADCLPVFFCNRAGNRIAVAHAGWRGLAEGILQSTIDALGENPAELLAWLGPAIGPRAYEVGDDVVEAFPNELGLGFRPRGERWLMDICAIARSKLGTAGVKSVYGGNFCTFENPERFFSYRRDGDTGRMASLVWLE